MKFFCSTWLEKVKVGFVFSEMKTLLALMLGFPIKASDVPPETIGVVTSGVVTVGLIFSRQVEGCPVQVHPVEILQDEHPGLAEVPVSHCSPPKISPSPH